ncbi:MAG: hypothetical protein JW809_10015 [Pirellulales bacterium]|nr:hypothetical protein [Pirellulales bacterium]
MNPDRKQLERRLERATAARLAPGETLDPETAALREGWLAWTRLLDGACPDLRASEKGTVPLARANGFSSRRFRGGWQTFVAAAAAASIAAVLGVTGLVTPNRQAGPVGPAAETFTGSPGATAATPAASDLAWDDGLDDAIASFGQALIEARRSPSRLDGSFDAIQRRLQQMEQDLSDQEL